MDDVLHSDGVLNENAPADDDGFDADLGELGLEGQEKDVDEADFDKESFEE